MLDALGPFGTPVWRITESLVNKAPEGLFRPAEAARSTRVLIYNHSRWPLHLLGASFESGGFAACAHPPALIEPKSVGGYRVEGAGPASGVTGAVVQYGFRPTDQYPCLWLVTSNPFGGCNSWNGQGYDGLAVRFSGSVGPANQVDFDVWDAAVA
ncbi:hypothetical protein [Dankookia sp. P2]|uniref:hypothetical protein n=1 Tax=Dankookia sp. P2 TaxID=3423955 RepID=UPI003D66942A